jgi:hypothetical protein
MSLKREHPPHKIAILIFLCAIPVLGGIIGLILSILGIVQKNRTYLITGVGGILVTTTLVLVLNYQTTHRGSFDKTRIIVAKQTLSKMLSALELFKLNYSEYPENLNDLRKIDNTIMYTDPLQQVHPKVDQNYFYKRVDSGYYLFSRGFDAKPFTSDDLLPDLSGMNPKKLGLRIP